jgi:hypothetical protein
VLLGVKNQTEESEMKRGIDVTGAAPDLAVGAGKTVVLLPRTGPEDRDLGMCVATLGNPRVLRSLKLNYPTERTKSICPPGSYRPLE